MIMLEFLEMFERKNCYDFFFPYLLVLIQLYFKNWILFCVLYLDYVRNGENERKKNSEERERIDIIVTEIIF